jgi:cob(I)alamin adenosyltransferase
LLQSEAEEESLMVKYINRLSDYLFTLSRSVAHDLKATEIPWQPRI